MKQKRPANAGRSLLSLFFTTYLTLPVLPVLYPQLPGILSQK
jgi:hypothetical protein